MALTAVQSAVSYMVTLVGARTTHLAELRFGPGCRCDVPPCHIRCRGVVRAMPYRGASWNGTCLTACSPPFSRGANRERLAFRESFGTW